jgi:mono/diheme cytochrome c family protein
MAQGSAPSPPAKKRHVARTVALVIVGLFVAIQLVPYGRDHTNPPVTAEPAWDTPQTRELASTACFDCHSNETVWPWYTNVAPMSWLIQRDVDEGRARLNFSQWDQPQDAETDEIGGIVLEGEMPPTQYTILHRSASLSDADTQALADGLEATIAASPPVGGEGGESGESGESGEAGEG